MPVSQPVCQSLVLRAGRRTPTLEYPNQENMMVGFQLAKLAAIAAPAIAICVALSASLHAEPSGVKHSKAVMSPLPKPDRPGSQGPALPQAKQKQPQPTQEQQQHKQSPQQGSAAIHDQGPLGLPGQDEQRKPEVAPTVKDPVKSKAPPTKGAKKVQAAHIYRVYYCEMEWQSYCLAGSYTSR